MGNFCFFFCARPPSTPSPTPAPTQNIPICPNGPTTYIPGDLGPLINSGAGSLVPFQPLLVSKGLNGRIISQANSPVPLNGGTGTSVEIMHKDADGAATVWDTNDSTKYYLISNSETFSSGGGVGIFHFDSSKNPHEVIDYYQTQRSPPFQGKNNCSGGRTPWNTWLSSEESQGGQVWEINPNVPKQDKGTSADHCKTNIVPKEGGFYESNAYWESKADNKYYFFTTEDSDLSNYLLTRFVPDSTIPEMLDKPVLERLCGSSATGKHSYLRLLPDGTIVWSSSRLVNNADQPYPNAEGMDIKGNTLLFVTKSQRRLYTVDLVNNTWESMPTLQGDGNVFKPDQIGRITGKNSVGDMIYFAEDGGGTQDIHARRTNDRGEFEYLTIAEGFREQETTGVTFSPDNLYLYFATQETSEIWQIWREDGCSFGSGVVLDSKFHKSTTRYLTDWN